MTPTPEANFDRVARIYRWAEYLTLGPLLQRTRTHFLPQISDRRQALVLGDGDGRFLAQLLSHNPDIHALAVDTSAAMLHLLRGHCRGSSPRFDTQNTTALTIQPPPNTDLIVTHFFLDCLTQPQLNTLTHHLSATTKPGTLWLLSDFQIPQSPLAPLVRLYIRALYFAFRILTNLRINHLPNPQIALSQAGFQRITHHECLFGILYTELWRHS